MYGGYAWLTNAVRADTTSRRLLLFAAMGAYFVLALSVPPRVRRRRPRLRRCVPADRPDPRGTLHALDRRERRHGQSSRSRGTTWPPLS